MSFTVENTITRDVLHADSLEEAVQQATTVLAQLFENTGLDVRIADEKDKTVARLSFSWFGEYMDI